MEVIRCLRKLLILGKCGYGNTQLDNLLEKTFLAAAEDGLIIFCYLPCLFIILSFGLNHGGQDMEFPAQETNNWF